MSDLLAAGIGDKEIDFDKLYQWLDDQTVTLPETDGGDSISPREVTQLLLKVQNRRSAVDRIVRTLERRDGECKRRHGMLVEMRRLQRSEMESDNRFRRLAKVDREAAIARGTGNATAEIAIEHSKRARIEAALRAAKNQLDTLETAKQTLNTLSRISESDGPSSYRRS